MLQRELFDKIKGCWCGKNIGGTLGAPMEWYRQINELEYYLQSFENGPIPNDDVDIQLLWLWVLEKYGIEVSACHLADAFNIFVTPHWSEYGTCKANMKLGLVPPVCGDYNNVRRDCNGAYIRSEIWACICAGNPTLAAEYMYKDAIIDHGGRAEGLYAAIFTATMESAAFVEKDMEKLIDIGLSYIPGDCSVAKAIAYARTLATEDMDWLEARNKLLTAFQSRCQTYFYSDHVHIDASPDDLKNNRYKGPEGWNAPLNLGIIVYSMLYAKGDFSKAILTAVRCGEDTDCTAATIGALYGIIDGYEKLPQKWKDGIGIKIKTVCLNLGELGCGGEIPDDIEDLTERMIRQFYAVGLRYGAAVEVENSPCVYKAKELFCNKSFKRHLYRNLRGPIYEFPNYEVMVDYIDGCEMVAGEEKRLAVKIRNKFLIAENARVRFLFDGVEVRPTAVGNVYLEKYLTGRETATLEISLFAERLTSPTIEGVMELTIVGKCNRYFVPVTLVNGSFQAKYSVGIYDDEEDFCE